MGTRRMEILLLLMISVCAVYSQRETPPKIIKPDIADTQNLRSQSKVTLACTADGIPKPTFEWKKDGKAISSSAAIQQDPDSGELHIAQFSLREIGSYQCFASNVIAEKTIKAMSPITILQMASMGEWDDVDVPPRLITTEGEAFTIMCPNPPASTPAAEFKWYMGNEQGAEITQTKRIAIDQDGNLHFAYVIKDDNLSGNEYKCAMFNRFLDLISLGGGTILDVLSLTPIPERKPSAVFSKDHVKALISHDVSLECVFSGHPLPTIKWLNHKSMEVTATTDPLKYEFTDENLRVLKIKKVEESDEGIYTCTGTNKLGSDERITNLNVTSVPIWVKALGSETLAEGKDADMICSARPAQGENALAPPEWFENGEAINQDKISSGKYVYSENERVLTVTKIEKPADVTCFQCKVSNSEGFVFSDGCLDIIDPIIILQRPPEIQRITKGDIVNLTVTAESKAPWPLQYTWFFNNQTVDKPNFAVIDTNTVYINTEELSDEDYRSINGTYIREVHHLYERINITMQVVLNEAGVVGPIAAAAGMDLWWIALLIGILLLVCVIVIICVVCRRKAQEGVYPLDKKERANDLDPEKDLADSGFHDLSRADDNGLEKKGAPLNFTDEPFNNEDEDSLEEYGEDPAKFNEDGSFIGIYMDKKTAPKQNGGETQI